MVFSVLANSLVFVVLFFGFSCCFSLFKQTIHLFFGCSRPWVFAFRLQVAGHVQFLPIII